MTAPKDAHPDLRDLQQVNRDLTEELQASRNNEMVLKLRIAELEKALFRAVNPPAPKAPRGLKDEEARSLRPGDKLLMLQTFWDRETPCTVHAVLYTVRPRPIVVVVAHEGTKQNPVNTIIRTDPDQLRFP